jgi:glycosyltransferase involved in cell wall biosynthesis
MDIKRIKQYSFDELPFVRFTIFPYYPLRFDSSKLKQIYNGIIQFFLVLIHFRIRHYDLAYFDRANIVLAAIFSILGINTVVRFLGIANFKYLIKAKCALLSPLVFLSLKVPYSLVVCTEDGSPSKKLFSKCLNKNTPCKIILNGVDKVSASKKDTILVREKYNLNETDPIILFVGRLVADKGAQEFIDALIQLKNHTKGFRAIMICGGGGFTSLQDKIKSKGMDELIIFEKYVEQKKILYYFQQSDIYVSLNTLGNLSNTVLEAMAAGNCIVMLDKDKETQTDESTERLVPADVVVRINRQNIVNDLTNKLIDLIDNPEITTMYSDRMKMFAKDFLWSWDERVNYEMELLEMVAKGNTIEMSMFQNVHNERKGLL